MSGRRVAEGDDFVLYLMAIVILCIALVFALAYVVYFFANLGAFVMNILSLGMG